MREEHAAKKHGISEPPSLDTHEFKEIEKFSKEVCQNLASKHGDRFTQSKVVYGLTSFLTAVSQAVKKQARHKGSRKR